MKKIALGIAIAVTIFVLTFLSLAYYCELDRSAVVENNKLHLETEKLEFIEELDPIQEQLVSTIDSMQLSPMLVQNNHTTGVVVAQKRNWQVLCSDSIGNMYLLELQKQVHNSITAAQDTFTIYYGVTLESSAYYPAGTFVTYVGTTDSKVKCFRNYVEFQNHINDFVQTVRSIDSKSTSGEYRIVFL